MKILKVLNRCGCPAERLGLDGVEEGPWTCCPDCGDAPMVYVILSACNYRMPSGELLLPKGCTALVKDCIRGCDYSSRWSMAGEEVAWGLGQFEYDAPRIPTSTDCIRECQPTLDDEDNVIAPGSLNFDSSGIGETPWGVERGDVGVIGPCGTSVDVTEHVKWWTKRSSGFFILNLVTREGYTAVWSADTTDCTSYASLTRTECDPELEDRVPRKLCVVPIESEPRKCCDDAESQCNCNDPGVSSCSDIVSDGEQSSSCDGEQRIRAIINGCDGDIAFDGHVYSIRYHSATGWPTGITFPSPTPCGAFLFSISTGGDCGLSVYLVLWCDGSSYHIEAWCLDGSTWVSQGEGTVSVEQACDGPILTFTLPELACCCPAGPPPVPCGTGSDTIPAVLVATDGTNNVTLTYNGGTGQWEGTGVLFGCASGAIGISLDSPASTCDMTMGIANNVDITSAPASPSFSPFSVDFIYAASCNGGTTITVTEP